MNSVFVRFCRTGSIALNHAGRVLLVTLFFVVTGVSQSSTDGLTPPALTPGSPSGSYSLTDFENINLFNGNLNFHLPLVKVGGRGSAQTALVLKVETRWRIETHESCSPCQSYLYPTYNWWTAGPTPGYSPGSLAYRFQEFGDSSCQTNPGGTYQSLLRVTFTAADGTEYELRSKLNNGQQLFVTTCQPPPAMGREFVTPDGTSVLFVFDIDPSNVGSTLTGDLVLKDGTRYRVEDGVIKKMRDRNGNRIQFTYELGGSHRLIGVTDSLGRIVSIEYDQQEAPYGLHDKIIYSGVGNTSRIVRVSRALLSTVLRFPFVPQSTLTLFPELSGPGQFTFDTYVVSEIWFPNGKSYSLRYNSFGELARVVLPSGGAIEYDWDAGIEKASGPWSGVWLPNIYRRVVERRTYANGGSGNQYDLRTVYGRQEYIDVAPDVSIDRGYVTVDQYAAGGTSFVSRTKHYFFGYGSYVPYNPFTGLGSGVGSGFYVPWKYGKEHKTESLDSAGTTVLRRVINSWDQPELVWWTGLASEAPPNGPRIMSTKIVLADALPNKVNKKDFHYSDDGYNNLIAVEEYDYGSNEPPAHPIRRTETDYVDTASYLANGVHLVSLPKEQRVYALDANGAVLEPPVAITKFFYDQTALVPRTGIVGLDPNFNTTSRGNLTTATRSVDGAEISSTKQYDVAGNVVSVTDPMGRTTTVGYADSFSDSLNRQTFAFPTSSTSPIPDTGTVANERHGSNTAFITTAVYEYYSGLPTSFTDANGKTTTFSFVDALDRLTGITRPSGGGMTSFEYGDNVGDLFVRTFTDLDVVGSTTRRIENYQYFDGMGRSTRSFTFDGTAVTPWVVADTHYDGAGRVLKVSNPYRVSSRSATVPACGTCTTTVFDMLGRVERVTYPGGATSTNSYNNDTVTTTDPAMKKRSATSDGLGRLLSVVENPGASPSYTTNYVYDRLNNLRKVTQGTQTRYFFYDQLSRLRRERNPEHGINTNLSALTDPITGNTSWSVEYEYNNNGLLTKKTDPRNISTTIAYDRINRPITRSYSDATPPVDFLYDGARVSGGIANSKGRLTSAITSSAFSSKYSYDSFDDMGRVLQTTQTVESNPAYLMSYQYNLAGLLTSETYPSGKSFATSYDVAGRIGGVTGPSNRVFVESFSYSPHGGVAQMKLGNQLWEHTNFNNRLQTTEIGIGTGETGVASVDRLKLNYDHGVTDNNGNVRNQTITVPTIGAVTGTTLNQCYTYDEFNRLKIAEERSGATACLGSVIWTQKYTYDQQGNKRFDIGTTIPIGLSNPTINTANNNRIDNAQGYLYDLAGNITQDPAHSYAFDAEQRQRNVDAGAVGQYFYDGQGQRVKSITSAGTTVFVYDAMSRLIAEYTSGAATGSGTSYVTTDPLGSPRAITGQDKSVKARHDYLPFGEQIPAGYGSRTPQQGYVVDTLRQKFTGKERDIESGLDYFSARYYSSSLGRFNSADSMFGSISNPQTLNRYAYVLNNPLGFVDPTGHGEISVSEYDGTEEKLRQLKEQSLARQRARDYEESLSWGKESWWAGLVSTTMTQKSGGVPFVVSNVDELEKQIIDGTVKQYLDENGFAQCARLPLAWQIEQEGAIVSRLNRSGRLSEDWVMGDELTHGMNLQKGTVVATFNRATGEYAQTDAGQGGENHTAIFLGWAEQGGIKGMRVAQQMSNRDGRPSIGFIPFKPDNSYHSNAGRFNVVTFRRPRPILPK